MFLLLGGDSEVGGAVYRDLKSQGISVLATTRRRGLVSPERPFFDILDSLDAWEPPPGVEAACIFLAVARLRDCASDPIATSQINVTQTLRLIDRLLARNIYVLFLSSNQVFDGEQPHVQADAPVCPVSEYGRQKADTETAIRSRIEKGAPIAILRLSKVLAPDPALVQNWSRLLLGGKAIQAFDDMVLAPVPIALVAAAIRSLLAQRLPGIFQLSGPRDVTYFEISSFLAKLLGVDPGLVKSVSAYSTDMPIGSTPRNTTLDSAALRDKFGIGVPDVWQMLSPAPREADFDIRTQATRS
jgi:dTDP-4-dehydrorhamnose reductase